MNVKTEKKQWIYLKHKNARLVCVVLKTTQGFVKIHNRSNKHNKKLRHSLTQIALQRSGII